MTATPTFCGRSPIWSAEAFALAAQAKVLSGSKLEQLVVRLQRHTGRSREACWRFVIHGIKGRAEYRRWTEEEIETVREELVRRTVNEIAQKIHRSAKSIRNMLRRNNLRVREIRCDIFSVESLAKALRVRKTEILFWIERGWLEARCSQGKRRSYTIAPEALAHAYKNHLPDILKRGLPNWSLFDAYVQYVHSPKHTVGEQLLDVRRDKRERAAFAESEERRRLAGMHSEEEDEDDESDEEYRANLGQDAVSQ